MFKGPLMLVVNYTNLNQMFEQSQEEQQSPCVMCDQQNQQMLMLSCVHDPCINCAAVHYVENQPHNSKIYTCVKCGQQTQLDGTSVIELQKLYKIIRNKYKPQLSRSIGSAYSHKQRVNTKPQNHNQFKTINEYKESKQMAQARPDYKYNKARVLDNVGQSRKRTIKQTQEPSYNLKYYPSQPVSQPSYTSNPKKAMYQLQYPCGDHPEEQLTYFCFSCNKPICPQCAIHGNHKDHQVETTRKAIKQIRVLLNEDKAKLQHESGLLLASKDRSKKLSKEWSQQNRVDQDFIKKKFTHFRNIILQKQKELMKISDHNLQKNSQIIKIQNSSADKALDELNKTKKTIDITLKKQELCILQQFNQRDQQVNQILSKIQRDNEKQNDYMVKNPHKSLNLDQFEDDFDRLIDSLHSLKLTTTSKS